MNVQFTYIPVWIRPAQTHDVPHLARMNRRLIQDEGSRNPMDLGQLEARLRGWLERGEWTVDVVETADEGGTTEDRGPRTDDGEIGHTHHAVRIIGYAVYQQRVDDYDPAQPVVYVRQFYIERERRGQGLGRRAFAELAQERFPPGAALVLDVLATNPRGRRFWESVGFREYCTTMKR